MSVITTVDVLYFRDATTGERTGCVDVCRSDTGAVHMRVNRHGEEVVLQFSGKSARSIAKLLTRADDEADGKSMPACGR